MTLPRGDLDKLPLELRWEIYSYIITATIRYGYRCVNLAKAPRVPHPGLAPPNSLAIMRVCKGIHYDFENSWKVECDDPHALLSRVSQMTDITKSFLEKISFVGVADNVGARAFLELFREHNFTFPFTQRTPPIPSVAFVPIPGPIGGSMLFHHAFGMGDKAYAEKIDLWVNLARVSGRDALCIQRILDMGGTEGAVRTLARRGNDDAVTRIQVNIDLLPVRTVSAIANVLRLIEYRKSNYRLKTCKDINSIVFACLIAEFGIKHRLHGLVKAAKEWFEYMLLASIGTDHLEEALSIIAPYTILTERVVLFLAMCNPSTGQGAHLLRKCSVGTMMKVGRLVMTNETRSPRPFRFPGFDNWDVLE